VLIGMLRHVGKSFLPLALLLVVASPAFSTAIEDLTRKLTKSTGRERVDVLNELSKAHWGISSDKTITFAEEALSQAREHHYSAGEACALRYIGIGYWYKDNYQKALDFSFQALKIFESIQDSKGIASCKSTIGTIYLNLERFDEALKIYHEALELAEKTGDQNRIGIIVSNIGTCYLGLKKYKEALPFLFRSLEALQKSGSQLDILTCLGNIAGAYRRLEQFPKALEFEQKVLEIATKTGSTVRIIDALMDIGEIQGKLGQYEAGLQSVKHAMEMAEKENLKRNLQDAERVMVGLYEAQGKYQEALEHQKKLAQIRDTVFTEESNKEIADLQVKYETEKKEKEIRINKLEIEKQKEARNALIGISILVMILALVTYSRYRAKKRANELLEKLSRTDPMTGLANRRALLESLERERLRWKRQQIPFSVILADVDHFKKFNDRYGHDVGDLVLIEVAKAIRNSVREIDEASRWGGEEFLVLLRECPAERSIEIAERIQQNVRETSIPASGEQLRVTATMGVSTYSGEENVDAVVKRADLALYEGKQQGRNRIVAQT
jgi:diguanylate cyclase (GGDEF)-like protein